MRTMCNVTLLCCDWYVFCKYLPYWFAVDVYRIVESGFLHNSNFFAARRILTIASWLVSVILNAVHLTSLHSNVDFAFSEKCQYVTLNHSVCHRRACRKCLLCTKKSFIFCMSSRDLAVWQIDLRRACVSLSPAASLINCLKMTCLCGIA